MYLDIKLPSQNYIILLIFEQVKGVVKKRREEYVLDSSLGSCPVDEINNTFSIALMCLETDPSKRPTMAEVVKMLQQIKSEKALTDS